MRKNIFILFVLFIFISCSERMSNYYETCSDTDFEQNMWLPEFIKDIDCRKISLYHDLDTNEIWGKFYIYDDSDFEIDNNEFIMHEKYKKRLNKIGLEKEFNILKVEDNRFNVKLFTTNPEENLFFFYGKAKIGEIDK